MQQQERERERVPFLNSTGAAPYQYNGHLPKILVMGIDDSQNQFTRAIEAYGLDPIHRSSSSHSVPLDADAAIVVTSYVGHKDFYHVKDEYKRQGKKVFFARDGFSEIKEEFEQFFFGDIRKVLETCNWVQRVTFFVAFLTRREGVRFKYNELLFRIMRYYPEIAKFHVTNTLVSLKERGVVSQYEGRRGHYVFHGYSEKLFSDLKKAGMGPILKEEWLHRPEPVVVLREEVLPPEPVAVVSAPELVEPPQVNLHQDLLLDAMSSLEKKMDRVLERLDLLEKKGTSQLREKLLRGIEEALQS